jgi:hypothetical protein
MLYKVNLYVLNKTGQVSRDEIFEIDSPNDMTAKQLKDSVNKGEYVDVLSEEFMIKNKFMHDDDIINFPFILYTIKLK